MGANASIVEARAIKMARVEGDALIFMVHCLFCVWSMLMWSRWIGWIHRIGGAAQAAAGRPAACCGCVDGGRLPALPSVQHSVLTSDKDSAKGLVRLSPLQLTSRTPCLTPPQ